MVIMLSTFHTCMSFYGSISYIMTSSGIQSLLELIYAEYTFPVSPLPVQLQLI